ncbi:4677_t:CDS:2, partial [Gigaspora margarita]
MDLPDISIGILPVNVSRNKASIASSERKGSSKSARQPDSSVIIELNGSIVENGFLDQLSGKKQKKYTGALIKNGNGSDEAKSIVITPPSSHPHIGHYREYRRQTTEE